MDGRAQSQVIGLSRATAYPASITLSRPSLIVALDLPDLEAAERMVERLRPAVEWFKVGSMLFTAAGPDAVRMVKAAGANVFLDLKFHDIPQTIAGGVTAAARLGAALVTVHCAAGPAGLQAAARAARDAAAGVRVLGVTRLTSEGGRLSRAVLAAAAQAHDAGLDGVTAAVRDARAIKARFGPGFVVLAPGIRPAGQGANDQVRIATPAQAVRAGADYLVVGRPVTSAPDPHAAASAVLAEIARATRRAHAPAARPRASRS